MRTRAILHREGCLVLLKGKLLSTELKSATQSFLAHAARDETGWSGATDRKTTVGHSAQSFQALFCSPGPLFADQHEVSYFF